VKAADNFAGKPAATVFVVDDDASIREALSSLIRSVGLRVETYSSAGEFLLQKAPDGPACLVLDVRLPGLSGMDLQRELAASGNHLPIIFITGHGDIPMSVRAMKTGAVEFLTKPFRDQDLLDAIQQAIARDSEALQKREEAQELRDYYDSLTPREREVMAERRRVEEQARLAEEAQRLAIQSAFTLRSLAAGQIIAGRFRLEKLLGQGGMGVVWRARDEELRKTRALKLLKEELANDAGAIASLKDEVGRCQELTHRHIIRLFDLVKDEARGLVAISMEVAEGGSLTTRRLETPHRWFEPGELLPWVGQLCEALTYIHEEAGLVHRDIKPGNLLLDERGRLKLSDFGISGSLTESFSRLTGEQSSTGTPAYMSPEQTCGKAPHPSDDLYALGATLYELLTGQPPFAGSVASVRAQLLSDTPPPAITVRRSLLENVEAPIPPLWENVIATLLAKKAADRPATAREVIQRLRSLAEKPEASHAMAAAVESLRAEQEPEAAEIQSSRAPDGRVSVDPEDPLKNCEQMESAHAELKPPLDARPMRDLRGAPQEQPPPVDWTPSLRDLLRARSGLQAVEAWRLGEALAIQLDDENPAAASRGPLLIHEIFIHFRDPLSESDVRAKLRESVTAWPRFDLVIGVSDNPEGAETLVLGGGDTIFTGWDTGGDRVQQLARLLYELLGGVAGSQHAPLASLGEKGNHVLRRGILRGMTVFSSAVDLIDALRAATVDIPAPGPESPRELAVGQLKKKGKNSLTPTRRSPATALARPKKRLLASAIAGLAIVATAGVGIWKSNSNPGPSPSSTPIPSPIPTPVLAPARTPFVAPTQTPAPDLAATPEPVVITPPTATKDAPFENSLGLKFMPAPSTRESATGKRILFCVWPTRVKDFDAFAQAVKLKSVGWLSPGFKQGPDHPVVNVTWQEAMAFCKWLTDEEHKAGSLPANQFYRLPTDLEWSKAVGLPDEPGKTPAERDLVIADVYPWGTEWPPPPGAGNYTGEETKSDVPIKGYNDGFAWTSPVGSFAPNKYGLYDMGGNVWQWCMDSWNDKSSGKVLRGASWYSGALKLSLLSSCRVHAAPDSSTNNYGFRIVIATDMLAPAPAPFRFTLPIGEGAGS
jgi:FixJ family two-component response regulator/serine/threonine protein kinase